MTSMTLDLPRRFPWPALLSVGIHGAIVAGLLYTLMHQVIELPAPAQPISAAMVAPADLEPPQAIQPPPGPVIEPGPGPEPIPELPKETPMVIEKPKLKPKPKPEPVKKVEEQPKHNVKPAESHPASPVENTAPARTMTSAASAATSRPVVSAPSGPRALSCNQPQCPARAQTLRIGSRVRVKFNITPDGRVENVEILSARPASMFERRVRNAMRRWHYEADKPGSGLVVSTVFKLSGTTQVE